MAFIKLKVLRMFRYVLLALSLLTMEPLTAAPKQLIIGYLFPQERVLTSGEIKAGELSRINYAFANLKNGRLVAGFEHDSQNLNTLTALKRNHPQLQILISVGGWSWSGGFSDMALTPVSRARFIESAVNFIEDHYLDGIDIDWEYPGQVGSGNRHRPEDKQNFTSLLRELRTRLTLEGRRHSRRLVLSIAAGASEEFAANTELSKIQRYLDTINLMTYDFYVPAVDPVTGHHAPLRVNPRDPKRVSASGAVNLFERAGVPAGKIVLGVPFYGHAWTHVNDVEHGLFQRGKKSSLEPDYKTIKHLLSQGSYRRFWDAAAGSPYLYSKQEETFVTYEDPESLRLKCEWAVRHRLGGLMFWEYSNDDGDLLGTLSRCLPLAVH